MEGVIMVEVENSVAVTARVLVEVSVLTTSFPLNVSEMRVVSVSVRVVRYVEEKVERLVTKLVEALMGGWGGRDRLPISLASKEMSREVRSGWSSPGRRRLWVTGWTVYSVFVTREVIVDDLPRTQVGLIATSCTTSATSPEKTMASEPVLAA